MAEIANQQQQQVTAHNDKIVLLSVGDGPEGVEIYTSEERAVVDGAQDIPALYVDVSLNNAVVHLGPFTLSKPLIAQVKKQLASPQEVWTWSMRVNSQLQDLRIEFARIEHQLNDKRLQHEQALAAYLTASDRNRVLVAERDLVRDHLTAIVNDQCWVKKVDVETLLPKERFLKNCDAHYECLKRGELPEVNVEADCVRQALLASVKREAKLADALRNSAKSLCALCCNGSPAVLSGVNAEYWHEEDRGLSARAFFPCAATSIWEALASAQPPQPGTASPFAQFGGPADLLAPGPDEQPK